MYGGVYFSHFLPFYLFYLFATFERERERAFLLTQVLFFILQSVFGKGVDGEKELITTLEKVGHTPLKIKLLLPVSRMNLTLDMGSAFPD